jgi:hypothetical protein
MEQVRVEVLLLEVVGEDIVKRLSVGVEATSCAAEGKPWQGSCPFIALSLASNDITDPHHQSADPPLPIHFTQPTHLVILSSD